MIYSRIIGTGSYLPHNVLTNKDLESIVDTTDDWIVERTGIKKRHIANIRQTTSELAEQASISALQSAGIDANNVDLIILATTTPDIVFPSTACLLQQKLAITNGCPAFDVQAVCTGFIYALSIADKYIRSGEVKNALVIGAEKLSSILNWDDRGTCILFGDGAGAVVLQASETPGILSTRLHADGQYKELLTVPAGISNGYLQLQKGEAFLQMRGNEVFKMAVIKLGELVDEILQLNNMTQADLDWLIPHQANIRIIKATAKKLKLPMEKVIVTVDQHGNTSAASVPLALDFAVKNNKIQPGQTLLLEAFGGGFTWGSALLIF